MTSLHMDLKPLGKKYFTVTIHDERNALKLFSDGRLYILPDPDQSEEDYDLSFWKLTTSSLKLHKVMKLGRRLSRKGKEIQNIPVMRSCAR